MARILLLFLFLSLFDNSFALKRNDALWRVDIETVDYEEPTYEIAQTSITPSKTIKNCKKVPGRLFITLGSDTLYDSGDYILDTSGMTIRVRGNASAVFSPQKPYKINLQKKADLLCDGGGKDKDWLLMWNNGINSMIGFSMCRLVGLQWTPRYKYVNVYFNGEYRGLYLLCESVKKGKHRLNISDSGVIFEFDPYWWNEEIYAESVLYAGSVLKDDYRYTFKYPKTEKISEVWLKGFNDYIRDVEGAVISGHYSDYLDGDSFASWVLGQDLLGNSNYDGSNIYMTKENDAIETKIKMATLWDFDGGILAADEKLPHVFAKVHRFFYFQYLFDDSDFVRLYVQKYDSLSAAICDSMITLIDNFTTSKEGKEYAESYERNRELYDYDTISYNERVEAAKTWFRNRKARLDPVVDELRSTITTGINYRKAYNIPEAYYNLNGIRLYNRWKGLYIKNGKKYLK